METATASKQQFAFQAVAAPSPGEGRAITLAAFARQEEEQGKSLEIVLYELQGMTASHRLWQGQKSRPCSMGWEVSVSLKYLTKAQLGSLLNSDKKGVRVKTAWYGLFSWLGHRIILPDCTVYKPKEHKRSGKGKKPAPEAGHVPRRRK